MAITGKRDPLYLQSLVHELSNLSTETEWVEFKVNDAEPTDIGEYISALANSAALLGKASAYLVWGIENGTHKVVGTEFRPRLARVRQQELESWLLQLLSPKINFAFHEVDASGLHVVVLELDPASGQPVQFQGAEHIRVGSYKKRLKEYPEKERALWRIFDRKPFEAGVAAERVSEEDVLQLLDYPAYFELADRPLPDNRKGIVDAFTDEKLIERCSAGGWNVLNLGAVLFAKTLSEFPSLRRKAMRVIQYKGKSRVLGGKEQEEMRGYASGFRGLIQYVNGLLPSNEHMGQALRKKVPMYPELAVRELVANALVHQDFSVTGSGPMIEIFEDRVEITNPGVPLVDPRRFVDTPPQSRNEALASLMRRFGVCEERGSGWDKVVFETEFYQLPAPIAERTEDHTRTVLFAHKPLSDMDRDERVRACYLHACLKYVTRSFLTNASLRARLGVEDRNKAIVSRYIREAVDADLIKPFDEDAGRKYMKYVPFWA